MVRALILAAGILAIAGSAAAADAYVVVKIAGRDEAAIEADIKKAALKVCAMEYSGSMTATLSERNCARRVIARSHVRLEQARADQAKPPAQLAIAK
jgi:hypothetical protein